jgi:PTH1 family peptidyl-tRNA hydrolase
MQYMNRSGQPIADWARYRNVTVDSLIVIHDDLDLAFGKVRIKRGGGNGGHNGLRSVSSSLQSDDYTRVRIGIGRPVDAEFEIADWVLSCFSDVERGELESVIEHGADAIVALLEKGLKATQNLYN